MNQHGINLPFVINNIKNCELWWCRLCHYWGLRVLSLTTPGATSDEVDLTTALDFHWWNQWVWHHHRLNGRNMLYENNVVYVSYHYSRNTTCTWFSMVAAGAWCLFDVNLQPTYSLSDGYHQAISRVQLRGLRQHCRTLTNLTLVLLS